jgi:hypothetical protein
MAGKDVPSNWSSLSEADKARYFASVGDSNTVRFLVEKGYLDQLTEKEQRQIVAQAYFESAKLSDEHRASGLYSEAEWKDPRLQEAGTNQSRHQRTKGLRILYNPDAEDLKDQVAFKKKQ